MEVICDGNQKEDHSKEQFSRLSPGLLEGKECAAWVIHKMQGTERAAAVQRFSCLREPNTKPQQSQRSCTKVEKGKSV